MAIGMWPRGEVGAGVLIVSLSYGIGGPIVTVGMLSLAVNLVLTGVFQMNTWAALFAAGPAQACAQVKKSVLRCRVAEPESAP